MNVSSAQPADPLVMRIAKHCQTARTALIVGAPGMGKSSILHAVTKMCEPSVWISGEVVAGEGHLASLLDSTAGGQTDPNGERLRSVLGRLAANSVTLAVDDLDTLISKREGIAAALNATLEFAGVRLIGTAHPASVSRLSVGSGLMHEATVFSIGQMTDATAQILVARRAPTLSERLVARVVEWAGGHPAALVYLSRLAELAAEPSVEVFFERAAEFAGAVYAEPWTALGPQQRAILRQMALSPNMVSTTEVAHALGLPAAHVGAQLSRLVMEGLARSTGHRGRYAVAPLLARWIVRRAARVPGTEVD